MSPNVCVGGSFNIIHVGHRALLAAAVKEAAGGMLYIALTSDMLASKGYVRPSYNVRMARLAEVLTELGCQHYVINPLTEEYPPWLAGRGADPRAGKVTVIVVSEETAPVAERMNAERVGHGLEPLRIVVVPMTLAEDGKPIHARRIADGEVDAAGKLKRGGR